LGHIHKPQNLNEGAHPPVIYPGSIERIDFGEASEPRCFIIAEVSRGATRIEWRELTGTRRFIERRLSLETPAAGGGEPTGVTDRLKAALPSPAEIEGAIIKLTVEYPREYEALIDEPAIRKHAAAAFEFHLVRRPRSEARVRLPDGESAATSSPLELLQQYWLAHNTDPAEAEALQKLAGEIIMDDSQEDPP
jgi:exonuclease SbcD